MKGSDLDHLFMQAPVAICIVSGPQYTVELVNERMLEFLGRTAEIIGHPLQQTLTEAREQGLLAILDTVRATKQPYYVSGFPAIILINGVRQPRYFNLVFKPYFLITEEAEPGGVFCVAHNVTEAVLAHQTLEEEKQRTALALETGGLGMMATDWNTNTATADKRAAEIFGLDGSLPLEAYVERIHPDDRLIRQQAIEAGIATGNFDFEVRLLLPNGAIRWVRSRGTIQKNGDGKFAGSFGVVQDITAHKEFALALHKEVQQRTAELEIANRSLQKLNDELLRSNANLEEFARAASHDLKEPVRKMQVFASRLKGALANRLNDDETKVFSRMESAAERMGTLVDDLLDYSSLTHSPQKAELINLNEKLTRILADLELLIAEKKAAIEIGKLPVVRGHRRQLQQLFQNLLTNALKYSKPGVPPRVTITSKEVTGDELTIVLPASVEGLHFYLIEVSDNGIGFEPGDANRIFNVFTRLHGRHEYNGTGIGLSIAKKAVENHGGYIYASGEPGKGACFTVLLPV